MLLFPYKRLNNDRKMFIILQVNYSFFTSLDRHLLYFQILLIQSRNEEPTIGTVLCAHMCISLISAFEILLCWLYCKLSSFLDKVLSLFLEAFSPATLSYTWVHPRNRTSRNLFCHQHRAAFFIGHFVLLYFSSSEMRGLLSETFRVGDSWLVIIT